MDTRRQTARLLAAFVAVMAALACEDAIPPKVPTSTLQTGSGQQATVGSTLPTPLSVQVLDQDGSAAEGVAVTWTVTAGGGALTPGTVTTDADGKATAIWTLGSVVGTQSVTATVQGLVPVAFVATATPLVDELTALARNVRQQVGRRFAALRRPPPVRASLVHLGEALAFDKVLSGTKDISCMTCHHPTLSTGDGKSLSIGQGATGLGNVRTLPSGAAFIPRNSPALYDLSGLGQLFHDGRVAVENGTVRTPAGSQLTPAMSGVFEFGALSALSLFPVTDRSEMRGFTGNELAAVPDSDFTGIWAGIMRRLGEIPEYRALFEAAYPGTRFDQMSFAHASNAIAGYLIESYTFTNSPWDLFLDGSDTAMSESQLRGALAFVGENCVACHDGRLLTDQEFHNTALAQVGPGKGNGPDGHDDFGRFNVTGQTGDRYRFRTAPLRNVELTAPYGHAGEIVSLRDFVNHYDDATDKLRAYDPRQLEPALRGTLVANFDAVAAGRDRDVARIDFGVQMLDRITDFLRALTDPAARSLGYLVPARVPSGLPVDR